MKYDLIQTESGHAVRRGNGDIAEFLERDGAENAARRLNHDNEPRDERLFDWREVEGYYGFNGPLSMTVEDWQELVGATGEPDDANGDVLALDAIITVSADGDSYCVGHDDGNATWMRFDGGMVTA